MSVHPSGPAGKPLAGMRAFVACSEKTAARLEEGLKLQGAHARAVPVIEIRASASPGLLDAALDSLGSYEWVVFTSSYGVLHCLERMKQRRLPPDRLARVKICAIGPETASQLRAAHLEPALLPDAYTAEGIVAALTAWYGGTARLAGRRILLLRAREARDLLPRELSAAGAVVDVVACYENLPAAVDPAVVEELRRDPPHLLVFTSSLTVRNFIALLGDQDGRRLLASATVAALGPITAATVQSCGKKPEIVPPQNTVAALLEAIRSHFEQARAPRGES